MVEFKLCRINRKKYFVSSINVEVRRTVSRFLTVSNNTTKLQSLNFNMEQGLKYNHVNRYRKQ